MDNMDNDKLKMMLNKQLNREFFSSYLYLSISNYYVEENLDGFANWFEVQAKEELDHAMLFRTYLINKGAPVCLEKIEAPEIKYENRSRALKAALAHEQMITKSINDIYSQALECKDYMTTQFLDWFTREQGEEEKNASDLCKKYEYLGSDVQGLYLLNAELKLRIYAPPSLVL